MSDSTPARDPKTAASVPNSARTAAEEVQFHQYETNRIPWYVHVIWMTFWCLVILYAVKYLFPAMQVEFLSPP